MTWVITRLCLDCVDESCVEVCPVDCIYVYDGADKKTFPNMLYIDPEHCIDCQACVAECPVEAIYHESDVPEQWEHYIELNARRSEQCPTITERKPRDLIE